MKECPNCNKSYDDSLLYCLDDGTGLNLSNDSETTLTAIVPKPHKTTGPRRDKKRKRRPTSRPSLGSVPKDQIRPPSFRFRHSGERKVSRSKSM
jgi:hypothetical protein